MDVLFRSKKLSKACNEIKQGTKTWGHECAEKVMQRLNELRAAETLAEINTLPPARLHKLQGKRKEQLAVNATDQVRVIFRPEMDQLPLLATRGVDLSKVSKILILEVKDYHGT